MADRITLHSFLTPAGVRVFYARIRRKVGRCIVGQSLLLSRLSPDQRARLAGWPSIASVRGLTQWEPPPRDRRPFRALSDQRSLKLIQFTELPVSSYSWRGRSVGVMCSPYPPDGSGTESRYITAAGLVALAISAAQAAPQLTDERVIDAGARK